MARLANHCPMAAQDLHFCLSGAIPAPAVMRKDEPGAILCLAVDQSLNG
jgi:hypothetical protein